jgi:hypothetical protein
MVRQTRLLLCWGGLFALAIVVAFGGMVALFYAPLPSAEARSHALVLAEHRWAARPFSRYRLVLRAASWCRVDAEIHDERIVRVFENSCPGDPRTVSDLFAQIKQLDSDPNRVYCAPDGCECTEVRFLTVEYDGELGFPRAIRVRRPREPNWQGLVGYVLAHGLPRCLTPRDIDVVNVMSLQPLS